jgi:hypothetical protein
MATQLEDNVLTEQQELFCEFYAGDEEMFANGVKSYMKAYPDSTYASAKSCASVFLTNLNILARINELLEMGVLNDGFVDKQLSFLINQNMELGTKLAAIREYNALKKRITQKIEVSTPEEQALEDIIKDVTSDRNNLPDDSPKAEAQPGEDSTPSN